MTTLVEAQRRRIEAGADPDALVAEYTAAADKLGVEMSNVSSDEEKRSQAAIDRQGQQIKHYENLITATRSAAQAVNLERKRDDFATHYANYTALMDAPDFEKFSAAGAAIVNPTYEEALGSANIFGWRPGAKEIGNKVTFVRQNLYHYSTNGQDFEPSDYRYRYLTTDEVQIYNYLLAKEGEDSAQLFLDFLDDQLNQRAAAQTAKDINKLPPGLKQIAAGEVAAASGIDRFVSGIRGAHDAASLNADISAPTPMQYLSAEVRQNLGGVGGVAYDLVQTSANMAPSIMLSYVTGGLLAAAGAPAAVASAGAKLGTLALGASAGGNAYNEAVQQGYDPEHARAYGILVGASEAGLEYLIGGVSQLSGKYLNKLGARIANTALGKRVAAGLGIEGLGSKIAAKITAIDNTALRLAAKFGDALVKSGPSEGLEEGLQDVLEPIFKTLVFNEEYEPAQLGDIMYSALLGFLSAGVFDGAESISADREASIVGANIKNLDAETIRQIIDIGLEGEPGSTGYLVAQQLDAKLAAGEDVSPHQLGEMYALNAESARAAKQDSALAEAFKKKLATAIEAQRASTTQPAVAIDETAPEAYNSATDDNLNTEVISDGQQQQNAGEGDVSIRRGSEWDDSQNPGEQVRAVGEGAGRGQKWDVQAQRARNRQTEADNRGLRFQSPQEVGLPDGSDARTIRIISDDMVTADQELEAIVSAGRGLGLTVRPFIGKAFRTDGRRANAWVNVYTGEMFICADCTTEANSAWKIFMHEATHPALEQREVLEFMCAYLTDELGPEKMDEFLSKYSEAYHGLYDSAFSISEQISDNILGYTSREVALIKEVICDMVARRNRFGTNVGDYHDLATEALLAVRQQYTTNTAPQTPETAAATDYKTAPPVEADAMDEPVGADEYDDLGEWSPEDEAEWRHEEELRILEETYGNYRWIPGYIRKTPLSIGDIDKSSIPDFNNWRKKRFGTLRISKNGIPVDTIYDELSASAPHLFPSDITNPADQLMKISEVIDQIRGNNRPLYDIADPDAEDRIAAGMTEEQRTDIVSSKKIIAPTYEGQADAMIASKKEDLESGSKELVEEAIKTIAKQFDVGNYADVYRVTDVNLDVRYSTRSVGESADKNKVGLNDLARLMPVFRDAVKNAVGIEMHDNRYFNDFDTQYFCEMLGGYMDGGELVPVRFGAKIFKNGTANLYVVVCQDRITEADLARVERHYRPVDNNATETTELRATPSNSASEHSIADIVPLVKSEDVLRYIPDGLLTDEQKAAKYKALADTVEYTNNKNDAKYRELVEKGDIKNLTRLVQHAAEMAGYTIKAYHGTDAQFTVFDKSKIGSATGEPLYGRGFYFTDNWYQAGAWMTAADREPMSLYIKLNNPYYADINDTGRIDSEALIRQKYDGVIVKYGRETYYVVFDNTSIKSADPITYDDDGNVIPISKRFDLTKSDIRYDIADPAEEEAEYSAENNYGLSPEQAAYYEQRRQLRQNQPSAAESLDRAARQKAERVRPKLREEFTGTSATEKLGIKIANSIGNYDNTRSVIERQRALNSLKREISRAEARINATDKEKTFAADLAAGIYAESDIPSSMRRDKVIELADYYFASDALDESMLQRVRLEVNDRAAEQIEHVMSDADLLKPSRMLVLNERTPQRNMRHIFGREKGEQINSMVFTPVRQNEAERYRFVQRMMDEVREFKGADGKKRALNKDERALVQLTMEGRAAEEMVAGMEMRTAIESAAGRIAQDMADYRKSLKKSRQLRGKDTDSTRAGYVDEASKKFKLTGKNLKAAEQYARWLETQDIIRNGGYDQDRINNAATKFSELFDQFYDAINDVLVAHGYEPIGFIKGYAPHMQSEDNLDLLNRSLKLLGMNSDVGVLPASIAGMTADFKPNKRFDPYFLTRHGEQTDYDIYSGYESYVEYMSDVIYHVDDIMRVRQFEKYLRKKGATDGLGEEIDTARRVRHSDRDTKRVYLRSAGVETTAGESDVEIDKKVDAQIDALFEQIKNPAKYSNLAMYIDNYANILAGKQSYADRGVEYSSGRKVLTLGNRVTRTFGRAQVAGNLSSALNQLAQVPQIFAENGVHYLGAVRDVVSGARNAKFKEWAKSSDFLTGKAGVDYLVHTTGDMVTSALFSPLEFVDSLTATLAVRARYLKEIAAGSAPDVALQRADAYGEEVMGSRMRGSKPLAYHSKGVVSQMVHMFQLEAVNAWEHISQDLPRDFQEIAQAKGRKAAAASLAGVIVKMLLAAFVMNRLDDELYGGTPAPFDLFGLSANFIASGEGLTTNAWIRTRIDDMSEKLFGTRVFATEDEAREFDLGAALEDTAYNVSNDIPFVRNVSGLLGLGDNSLPMPDVVSKGSALWDAVKGDDKRNAGEIASAAVGLASEILPGGRQLSKTAGGLETLIRGGRFSGYGEGEKLRYPVERSAANGARLVMFGNSAVPESDAFYAAGMKSLTETQTRAYQSMTAAGMSATSAFEFIHEMKEIGSGAGSSEKKRQTFAHADLPTGAYAAYYFNSDLSTEGDERVRAAVDDGYTDMDKAVRTMNALHQTNKDVERSNIIRTSGLAISDKETMWLEYVVGGGAPDASATAKATREKKQAQLDAFKNVGLDMDDYLEAYEKYAEINAEDSKATDKAGEFLGWVARKGYSYNKQQVILETFGYYMQIRAEYK